MKGGYTPGMGGEEDWMKEHKPSGVLSKLQVDANWNVFMDLNEVDLNLTKH